MARGRKPKPIEQRDAEGNLGRRHLPEAIRTGGRIDPTPPEILGEQGGLLWTDMVNRLNAVGALDPIDFAPLLAMCIQWDRAMDADKVLRAQGSYAKGSMGQLVAHPALAIERAAQLAFLKFATEYAATPVARARAAQAQAARASQQELESFTEAEPIEIDAVEEVDG